MRIIKSLQCALNGLYCVSKEKTVRIMLGIALIVVVSAIVLDISLLEKAVVLLTITLVFGLELINSQVEKTLDIVEPQFSQKVREIKDISAGAVLIASFGAVLIGLLIFLPRLL
jgi:diacylglycerol kinase